MSVEKMKRVLRQKSEYYYCLHCSRFYKAEDVEDDLMCPFKDCDGSALLDGVVVEKAEVEYWMENGLPLH